MIEVQSTEPLKNLLGRIFERVFFFYPDTGQKVWRGLVGIDLLTPPENYSLQLEGMTLDEVPIRANHSLKIVSKTFPTRRLTVDEKFVNPPQTELERIRKESKRIREIFAQLTPQRLWKGPFNSPVPGAPTSGFGKRSILNGQPRSPHGGTDFSAGTGTPVRSPSRGKVVLASNLYYSGNTVILDHGQGLYSYFGHLSSFAVEEETLVSAGDLLGNVGATGRVTGPHLHWSVRLCRTRVDPLSLMSLFSE